MGNVRLAIDAGARSMAKGCHAIIGAQTSGVMVETREVVGRKD